jgi:glycosyltransferase involved in cell wall biosynthesis
VRQADAVRVLNEGERRACLRHGVHPDRVSVAPIPTDISRFRVPASEEHLASWRSELGIESQTPLALWVGRPDPVKDLPTLLNAFARVHRRIPEARLVLAGDLEETTIRDQIAALGLSPAVKLPGAVPHDELPPLYQIATVYVHSSCYEGLGLVMIEAAAAGLPVVSTATDGARDIVLDGVTGTLVPIGDAAALADALLDFLSNPDRARMMGERGRQHVGERFDQERTTAAWIDMWRAGATRDRFPT